MKEVTVMANIKSALKRARLATERNLKNSAAKSALKTAMKRFEAAVVNAGADTVANAYKTLIKKLDKAVGKGLLHKNAAARRKSKFTKQYNEFNDKVS
jgi:small subunit ribosomal protein S20